MVDLPERLKTSPLHDRTEGSYSQLYVARAGAIETYAGLEGQLGMLFARLLGVDLQTAGIVFYRIVNTRSRNTILEKLLHLKHGAAYDAFWNSLVKHIRKLDGWRNEVVHWRARGVGFGGPEYVLVLAATDIWDPSPNGPCWDVENLKYFHAYALFVTKLVEQLRRHFEGAPIDDAWLQIFREPVAYPPVDNHPLFPMRRELGIPPRS